MVNAIESPTSFDTQDGQLGIPRISAEFGNAVICADVADDFGICPGKGVTKILMQHVDVAHLDFPHVKWPHMSVLPGEKLFKQAYAVA